VNEAQRAILADALQDADYRALLGRLVSSGPNDPPPDADAIFDAIRRNYSPPPPPDLQSSLALAARAARVTDRVGAGLSAPESVDPVRTWAGRLLRGGAGLIELALPDRFRSIVGRHLLDVALIAGVLMILIGGLVGGAGVTSFGWVVLLAVLGVKLLVELLRSWMEHRRWWLALVLLFVGLAVCRSTAGVAGWPVAGLWSSASSSVSPPAGIRCSPGPNGGVAAATAAANRQPRPASASSVVASLLDRLW
jgi:hypothetical protein